jgi:uncharacterized membrane protein YfcA
MCIHALNKERIHDVLGTMLTGLIGMCIVLVMDYYIYMYSKNKDLALYSSNVVSSIVSTLLLNVWYKKAFSIKRVVFNLACALLSVYVGTKLGEIIKLDFIENECIRILVLQGIIGLIQFILGLITNIVSYRKLDKLDRKG